MHFASPWFLLGLPLLGAVLWRWRRARRERSVFRYSDLGGLDPARRGLRARAHRALPFVRVMALCLLIIALARPQRERGLAQIETEGIDIVLVLDVSGSMAARDSDDESTAMDEDRLTVAKAAVRQFIRGLHDDRLGLVVFAGRAFTQCPLTLDYQMLTDLLEDVHLNMVEDGTAIGMAVATALTRLRNEETASRVIVLLTDGENNRGEIDPVSAARAAEALGVKIYAVGVGSPEGAPIPRGRSWATGRIQYAYGPDGKPLLSKLDEETLEEVARLSGGQYYRATDQRTLQSIYDNIWKLEKSQFEIEAYQRYSELFVWLLWPGLGLVLLEAALSATWLRKVP
jgi:Ca-activated chloride channel family protein